MFLCSFLILKTIHELLLNDKRVQTIIIHLRSDILDLSIHTQTLHPAAHFRERGGDVAGTRRTSLDNCYSLKVDWELFSFPCAGGQLTSLSICLFLSVSLNRSEKHERKASSCLILLYITGSADIHSLVCLCVVERYI